MSSRSKMYGSEAQLDLALTGEGFSGPAETKGLLSLAYLLRHLKPSDAITLFQLSATVLEAKRWDHPLDRLSAQETPGWFPSQQIQDYLNHAKGATGRRFFDWAILTNGCEWRA